MNKDIVINTFGLSKREAEIKHRFQSNLRTQKPQPQPQHPPEAYFNSFLDEMQITMKYQAQESLASNLIHEQVAIMHEQNELMKAKEKNLQQVLQTMARPVQDDPRRALAELLAPLNKQIFEIKSFYEETKSTAQEIFGLFETLKQENSSESKVEVRKSAERTMNKHASQRQKFREKVQKTEVAVQEIAEKAEVDSCKKGLEYLQEQIQAVQRDTEQVENELQNRFTRIVEQCEKLKHLPQEVMQPTREVNSAKERVDERLGGAFDYEGLFDLLGEAKNMRADFVTDWKNRALIYPKMTKKMKKKKPPVREERKPREITHIPPPPQPVRSTYTEKPKNLHQVISQPTKQPIVEKTSRSFLESHTPFPEEESVPRTPPTPVAKIQSEDLKKRPKIETKKLIKKQAKQETIQTEEKVEDISSRRKRDDWTVEDPPAFETRPGMTKGEQTRITATNLLPQELMPHTTTIETEEPPLPTLEEQTTEAVTHHILTQLLKLNKRIDVKITQGTHKWLGTDQINDLVRLGEYFDAGTIERIGKEVLAEEIEKIQNIKEEDEYASDFESEKERSVEESRVETPQLHPEVSYDSRPKTPESYPESFDRPKAPYHEQKPSTFSEEPSVEEDIPRPTLTKKLEEDPVERRPEDVEGLLDPRILGRMNAAAIEHYVSALIESGHIPHTAPPLEHEIEPLPALPQVPIQYVQPQLVPQPVELPKKPTEIRVETPKEPFLPEIKDAALSEMPKDLESFFAGPEGQRLLAMIKSNPGSSAEAIMDEWVTNHISPRIQGPLNLKYPPNIEYDHPRTEFAIFGKPQKDTRKFNIEEEEKRLNKEYSTIPKLFEVPGFYPVVHETDSPGAAAFLVSESELSYPSSRNESIGSDIFEARNEEFLGGFIEYVRKAREVEIGQIITGSDISEGEVRVPEVDGLSTGEIPPETLEPIPFKFRVSTTDLLMEEPARESDGEVFDPASIFTVT